MIEECCSGTWGWTIPVDLTIDNIDSQTVLRYEADNWGSIGGFIATIYYDGNEYVTTDPLNAGYFTSTTSAQSLTYITVLDTHPRNLPKVSPNMSRDAYWIWNNAGVDPMTFEFRFGDITPSPTQAPTIPACGTAYSYSLADDGEYVSVSRDGGNTFAQIGAVVPDFWGGTWKEEVAVSINNVDANTVLRYEAIDKGVIGGFMATIYYEGNEYVTTNPITDGNFETSTTNLNYKSYYYSTYWDLSNNQHRSPNMSSNANWIWNGRTRNTITFYFDFGNILNLASCPTIAPTPEPTPVPTPDPSPVPTPPPTFEKCGTAYSYSMADDGEYVSVSRDGGNTFTQIGAVVPDFWGGTWKQQVAVAIDDIDANTVLRYEAIDKGVIGGFMATVYYAGGVYVTTNPITDGNFETSTTNLNYKSYYYSGHWDLSNNQHRSPNMSSDAFWIWNGQTRNTITFYFDFADIACTTQSPTPEPSDPPSAATVDPTTSPTKLPTPEPTDSPTTDPTKDPTTDPTSMPTESPTYSVCDTNDGLNVALLLDESGSIDNDEFNELLHFVDNIITYHLSPVSFVSVFEYASLAAFTQLINWQIIGDSSNRANIVSDVYTNSYNQAGLTFTWDAVSRVLDNIFDYRSTCSDGCQYRSDLLILITDGEPTDTVCPKIEQRMLLSDVDVVVIAVGVSYEKIKCLDVKDNYVDIIEVAAFDISLFDMIEEVIRDKTCNGQNTCSAYNRPLPGSEWIYNDTGVAGLGPVPTRSGKGGAKGNADP